MGDTPSGRTLPEAPVDKLRSAVESVLMAQSEDLRRGAEEARKPTDNVHDPRVLERFLSLLELAYLTASADGLADGERDALAHSIETATGGIIDARMLLTHFADLDDASEMLGRRERLGRTAANFTDEPSRDQAMRFAVVVAMADGKLDPSEGEVLAELGQHFGYNASRVQAIIDDTAGQLEEALA